MLLCRPTNGFEKADGFPEGSEAAQETQGEDDATCGKEEDGGVEEDV
jgi:hypothetical protein